MWTAYFQADGEHRHTIATCRFKHTADYEAEKFKQRMTNPVGVWWVWVEEANASIPVGDNRGNGAGSSALRHGSAERNDTTAAEGNS
jgi:hypothetical protein